ncbi:MAG: nucleoside hydrolase [Spirochaetales bacterium]|nr:nucleoside hydrolase [Spirochaetales bacterium]MCF7937686.1 nucleoside hydrolase [Spirochaetales bacterium]
MKPLLIDTDCGVDDAVAIMMALASKEVELKAVTTLSGNVGVQQVSDNVLRLLSYFDRPDIPVYRGAERALLGEERRAAGVHGENGLGGVELPAPIFELKGLSAPQALAETALAHPGLAVLALGPLTNLAMALNLYPEAKNAIGQVVTMGGSVGPGNVTGFAEFNYYADPEAAQFVFDSGVPLTVVPWDPAAAMMIDPEKLAERGFKGTKAGDLMFDMQKNVLSFIESRFGAARLSFPDPIAMAVLLSPEGVSRKIRGLLRMELGNTTMRGASVLWDGESMDIILEYDQVRFLDLLFRITDLQ